MSSKKERQNCIINLIGTYEIETQEELTKRLCAAGFETTQATVSRDIRQLGLTKRKSAGGRLHYAVLSKASGRNEKYNRVLVEGMVAVTVAQNILVIKTVEGMAMAVAAALDHMCLDEIVGTIAGDDTIFCVTRTQEESELLAKRLEPIYLS